MPNPAPGCVAFLSSGERSAARLRFEARPAYSAAVINFNGGDLVLQPIDSLGQFHPAPADMRSSWSTTARLTAIARLAGDPA
jgi:hypothetical protein